MSTNTETGFMSTRYRGKSRDLEAQEAELKRMQEELDLQVEDIEVDDPKVKELDEEETTFKKRYGDLRRYSGNLSKELKTLKEKIELLESNKVTAPSVVEDIPENDAEYEEWKAKYPEAARMVEVIAAKESTKATKKLEQEIEALKKKEIEIKKQEAELELTKLHPDWHDIRASDEFHDWVEAQPESVQKIMYENEFDFKGVARFLDLYKADKGRTTTKQEPRKRPAADVDAADLSVRRTPHTDPTPSGKVIKESEVKNMSVKEYQAREKEIMAAISSGNFVYDLSRR